MKDKGDDDDRQLIPKLTDELVSVRDARDGIPHDLFPLSKEDLGYYKFSLKGQTNLRGRRTWDIVFEPANLKDLCIHGGPAISIQIGTGPPDNAAVDDAAT